MKEEICNTTPLLTFQDPRLLLTTAEALLSFLTWPRSTQFIGMIWVYHFIGWSHCFLLTALCRLPQNEQSGCSVQSLFACPDLPHCWQIGVLTKYTLDLYDQIVCIWSRCSDLVPTLFGTRFLLSGTGCPAFFVTTSFPR